MEEKTQLNADLTSNDQQILPENPVTEPEHANAQSNEPTALTGNQEDVEVDRLEPASSQDQEPQPFTGTDGSSEPTESPNAIISTDEQAVEPSPPEEVPLTSAALPAEEGPVSSEDMVPEESPVDQQLTQDQVLQSPEPVIDLPEDVSAIDTDLTPVPEMVMDEISEDKPSEVESSVEPETFQPEDIPQIEEDTSSVELDNEVENSVDQDVTESHVLDKVSEDAGSTGLSVITKTEEAEELDETEAEEEAEAEEDLVEDPLETEEKYQTLLREELVTAMEEAVGHDDISKVKRRISLIRVAFLNKTREEKNVRFEKFIEEGGEKEAYSEAPDELEERFKEAFSTYKSKKASWENEQERIRQENLVEKKQILEQLKELINSEESLKKTYDEFKELQEKWSQIGMVPRLENNNLWQNYHFLVEKFFDKVKINRELRDLDLRRNLESKIALCEKVEELLLESSVDRSFRLLQQYHREWKEIGPVPMDKKEEVWERFKRTSDLINDKRREYYEQRQGEMDNNLLAKKELCEQAEAIGSAEMTSIRHWQDNTDKINELLKIWKTIGPAPRAQNDAVWNRFRGLMEAFFASKKEYFDKLKDEQLNNYNMKLDLCVQAESLKFSTDWRKTSMELINLQKRWKEIGPVPRKHSDKIWKRFRAACDDFFAAKSAHFSSLQGQESDNLRLKEDLIKRIEEYVFTEDKSENLDILKGFQREWMEIGHVPINDKDRLQKIFRDVIDRRLKDLNISSLEMTRSNYKNKLDSMRDTRDGGKMISRERIQMQNKISALQEEINLWENNLGFFAESKKAQILKEEFSKKISKAKQEVALLEAKLKMLREVE